MSKVVDERVVVLNFDNKKFEKNSKQTIKTLDNLKKSMDFSEVSDSMDKAYKNADPSRLEKSCDTVSKKFTAMEVVAFTVINRITNKMLDMGERFAKSLSVDQVTAAWTGYGEKIKSVATLVGQGFNEDVVNKQLEILSNYTDATSYNFTDMTNNISKFTAAGVDLEKATNAMMGIANWAAASGQNAQKASSAMYQLAQAIGAGSVKLQDWRSIQNVSMDTQEFRKQVLDTAVAMKQLKKNADGTYKTLSGKSFNINQFTTQMSEGWFTSDVLIATLEKYNVAAKEILAIQEKNDYANIEDAIKDYEDLIKQTERERDALKAEGKDITEISKKIDEMTFSYKNFLSAQEARTFGDAINATKDAVISGWRKSFENLFGETKEATELWTELSVDLFEIFASGAKNRNNVLKVWGGKNLVTEASKDLAIETLETYTDTLGKYGAMTADMWESFSTANGATDELKKQLMSAAKEMGALYDDGTGVLRAVDGTEVSLENWNDSLKSGWLTTKSIEKSIDAIKNQSLNGRADLFGIGDTPEETGALFNILHSLERLLSTVKEAWASVFGSVTAQGLKSITQRLQEFTVKMVKADTFFERFRDILRGVFSVGKLIVKLVKGVFIALKPIFSVFNSGGKSVLDLIRQISVRFSDWVDQFDGFEKAGQKVAVVTSRIAEVLKFVITKVVQLAANVLPVLKKILDFIVKAVAALFVILGKLVVKVYDFIKNLIIAIRESDAFKKALEILKNTMQKIWGWAKKLFENFKNFVTNISKSKIAEAIKAGCKKIGDAFTNMVNKIKKTKADDENQNGGFKFLDKLKEKLKVLSPVFEGLKNLWQGIKNLFGPLMKLIGAALTALGQFFTAIGERIEGFLQGKNSLVSVGELLKTTIKVGIGAILVKWISSIIKAITKVIDSLSMFLSGMKGHSVLERTTHAMMQFAEAMLMFTAAILILSKIDTDSVTKAMASIAIILGMYVVFLASIKKLFESSTDTFDGTKILFFSKGKSKSTGPAATMAAIGSLLLSISVSMLIISAAIKKIATIDEAKIDLAITTMMAIIMVFSMFLNSLKGFVKNKKSKFVAPGLLMFIGMAIAIKSMAKVITNLSELEESKLSKGIAGILAIAFALQMILKALALLVKGNKNMKSVTMMIGTLLSLSNLLNKMSKIFVDLSKMEWTDFFKGAAGIAVMATALITVLKTMTALDKSKNKNAKKTIGVLLALTLVFAVLTNVIKTIAKLDPTEFEQAKWTMIIVMAIFSLTLVMLKMVNIFASNKDARITATAKIKGIFAACLGIAVAMLAFVASISIIMDKVGTDPNKLMSFGIVSTILGIFLISLISVTILIIKASKNVNAASIKAMKQIEDVMYTLVAMLFVIAITISVLTKAINKNPVAAVTGLLILIASMTLLLVAVNNLLYNNKKAPTAAKVDKTLAMIHALKGLLLSVAAIIVATTLLSFGKSLFGTAISLILVMATIVGSVAVLCSVSKKLNETQITKLSTILGALAGTVRIFALIMLILNKVDAGNGVRNLLMITVAITLLAAVMAILSPMAGAMDAVAAAFLMFASSLLVLVAALWLLVEVADRLSNITLDPEKIKENLSALSEVATQIGSVLAGIIIGFFEGMADRAIEFIEKVLTYIGGIAFKLAKIVADLISGLLVGLHENGAINALVDIFVDMLERLSERLPELCDKLIDMALNMIDILIIRIPEITLKLTELAWTTIIGFIDALAESIEKYGPKLIEACGRLFQAIIDFFKKLFGINSPSSLFSKFGQYIWQGLVNGLKGMWDGVKKVWTDFKTNVSNWWNNLVNNFKEFGKNIINGLWNGLKSAWDNVTGWFKDAGNWIKNTWCNIFGIHSPSRVFASYGEYMVEGLAEGLDNTKPVADSIDSMANTVNNEMEKSGINDILSNVLDEINTDMNDDIVIRPVLDLSNIQNGISEMNSLMGSASGYAIGVNASGLTSDISSSMGKSRDSVNKPVSGQVNNTTNENIYNTFNITGTDANDIADKVSKELQKQVNRRNKVWA